MPKVNFGCKIEPSGNGIITKIKKRERAFFILTTKTLLNPNQANGTSKNDIHFELHLFQSEQ